MPMTPEDQATDYAAAKRLVAANKIADLLREAYLAGHAAGQEGGESGEDGVDPSDPDALLTALDSHPDVEIESRADKYPDVRDAMRVGTIDPEDHNEVLDAASELLDSGKIDNQDLFNLMTDTPADTPISDELRTALWRERLIGENDFPTMSDLADMIVGAK